MHCIRAIITLEPMIDHIEKDWIKAKKVSLSQNIALIPITLELGEDIDELIAKGSEMAFQPFYYLSKSLHFLLKERSHRSILGYVETDYFGGVGSQSSILYQDQRVELGPLTTETVWDENRREYVHHPEGKRAINQVLRRLGVWRVHGADEFDSIGLGHYRSFE